MSEIQKNTYTDLIVLKTYSDNAFIAKSITLDFLYNFNNPCLAILDLTNALNEDQRFAKIGLKCIEGIVLAVEEFSQHLPVIINYRFVEALLEVVRYRINDTYIEEYSDCMSKILQFIVDNFDISLLASFFSLIEIFKYCDLENDKNIEVFKKYCMSLDEVCNKLEKDAPVALHYNLSNIKILYKGIIDEKVKAFNQIFEKYLDKEQQGVYIFSNNSEHAIEAQSKIERNSNQKVMIVDEVEDFIKKTNIQKLFIIDFGADGYEELLYFLGKEQGRSASEAVNVVFKNNDQISSHPKLLEIVDRYNVDFEKLSKLFT